MARARCLFLLENSPNFMALCRTLRRTVGFMHCSNYASSNWLKRVPLGKVHRSFVIGGQWETTQLNTNPSKPRDMSLIIPAPKPSKSLPPSATSIPYLPARRDLGSLADAKPVVVIDTREQTPLPIARLPVTRDTLTTGDYSFLGAEEMFSIERKTVQDFIGCCVASERERFLREMHRLRGYRFKRLLIVGSRSEIEQQRYRGNLAPQAALGTLAMIEARYDVPVVFCASPEAAAELIERWVTYFARELVLSLNNIQKGLVRHAGTPAPDSAQSPTAITLEA